MGWDGSGNFNRSDGTRSGTQVWQDARDAGIKIRADDHDTHDQGIADGLENTVALDGQNTTTTDNALLRYDSGNSKFQGVSISASQIVGRGASGDVKGLNAASARALLNIGSATPTNQQALFWGSAASAYQQKSAASARALLGIGSAVPTNQQALFWGSAASAYQQKSAASARSLLGIGTASAARSNLGIGDAVYVSAGDGGPYISSTTITISTALTIDTWESIGPTGSGATNIWTALDGLPSDVDWIEVGIYANCSDTAASQALMNYSVYARKNGSAIAISNQALIAAGADYTTSGSDAFASGFHTRKIPISSRIFDAYWASDFSTTNIYLVLTGYGYNP